MIVQGKKIREIKKGLYYQSGKWNRPGEMAKLSVSEIDDKFILDVLTVHREELLERFCSGWGSCFVWIEKESIGIVK